LTLRVFALVCLVYGVALGQPADRRTLQAAVDRFNAADINGQRVAVQDLRGRVVLLDFWATWCAPCLAEIPTIREVQRRFGDRVAIVGVSVDVQDRASFIRWLRRQEIDWPQVFDGRGWTSPTVMPFELTRVPFSVIVGTNGRVVGVDVRGKQLLRSLDVLLNRVHNPVRPIL
jgi:thiol-disulfide isomerase/thioredoxin